jgi:non-specific serine/threonine protein kinase
MSMLVGRERERAAICHVLVRQGERLVTLTGPGGIGKTRLARAVAADLVEAFRGGVRFVDLSSVGDADLVVTAIAAAVDVPDSTDEPLLDTVARSLRSRDMLLVLDNFEHVLAAAPAISTLVRACPRLAVLVTSRTPLHLAGECEVPVPSLDVPDVPLGLDDLAEVAAVAMFVQRAQIARADFRLSATNAAAVVEICVRLDGLPLALEFAAARIKVLSAEQIASRLEDCFNLLTSGADDAPERHRTLRAALDWSYLMLDRSQQALLRRLAIFAGGAGLDAVERVCSDSGLRQSTVLDLLEQLVDHSLLVVREEGGEARYRLLETVRQYAFERLIEAGEESSVRARHLAWHVELAERAAPDLFGADQPMWLERLARDHDNIRSALTYAIAHGHAASAMRLGAGIWKFWDVRGHATEGQKWLESALASSGPDVVEDEIRARAQHGAANLAYVRGDYERATVLHEANVALRKQMGDRHGQAVSILKLADIMRGRGDANAAVRFCQQSLTLFRAVGDARWCANALNTLGMALLDRGATGAARAALEESLVLFRQVGGTRREAIALGNLGDVARAEGDFDRADALLVDSLRAFVEVKDAWGGALGLESLALVATERGEPSRAARLFGAAEAQREAALVPLPPADRPAHERAISVLRGRLGREALSSAWSYGRSRSLEETLELALEPSEERPPAPIALALVHSPLTEREREVAHLIARGLTNRQIADELVITKLTADKHVGNILSKLGAASRAQVAVWVVQHGPRVATPASAA